MLLDPEKSLCELKQKIIVSKDKGHVQTHRAINEERNEVWHYRLDGDLVKQQKCCDFLLINDTKKNAYLIELKGGNLSDAVPQLEYGEFIVRGELPGYTFLYRIVCSKAKTHEIHGNTFRKFQAKCGKRLLYREHSMEEKI